MMATENAVVWVESGGVWGKVGIVGGGEWLEFRGLMWWESLGLVVW